MYKLIVIGLEGFMGKALAIGEAIIIIKEMIESASDFIMEAVPNDFYSILDKMAFLTSDFLAISSEGSFLDNTQRIADAIVILSNFVIWGILLFYCFKSIFAYFMLKRVEVPWKFFIRMIVFGILANSAFFVCYTGVFFAENSTEYIRECTGKKISFSCLEEYISDFEGQVKENNEGSADIYTVDAIISIFIYFLSFFLAICLGTRYLIIRVLILVSPIFFILGGFSGSEKIFFGWCKIFIMLLFIQVLFSITLGIALLINVTNDMFLAILFCSILFIFCKCILGFFKLSF